MSAPGSTFNASRNATRNAAINFAAKEALARLKKKPIEINPDDFHTKLLVNPYRRRLLYLVFILCFAATYFWVFTHLHLLRFSIIACLPIVGCGLIMTLCPITEEWTYRPWQGAPRQYEKHYFWHK